MGPILGTELKGLDSTQYPLLSQPLELSVGAHFSSWEIAEHYIREYGRQKGFVVNRYSVLISFFSEIKNFILKRNRKQSFQKKREVVKFKRSTFLNRS